MSIVQNEKSTLPFFKHEILSILAKKRNEPEHSSANSLITTRQIYHIRETVGIFKTNCGSVLSVRELVEH